MELLRGATTIQEDTKEEIISAVGKLLDELFQVNKLDKTEVKGIIYSSTSDIVSFYPAKAGRINGYDTFPVFSALEPPILDGLPHCIRVLLFVDCQRKLTPVYQQGAVVLRKDITKIMNIALDGPAGSGKSTVAKALAKDYNILYLDTGAMYRACGLYALENGYDVKNKEQIESIVDKIDVRVEYIDGSQHTFLGDRDVSTDIRKNEVSMAASTISSHICIRKKMVEMQRKIAQKMSCVLDGRDIGSTVLPNAEFKFFVTADSKIRAERRYKELIERGQTVDFDKLHEEILQRDKQDSEREFSPLKQAEDAIVVDTSNMNVEEVIKTIKSYIQAKI